MFCKLLISSLIIFTLCLNAAGENTLPILATDDTRSYDLLDLDLFMNHLSDPQRDFILQEIRDRGETSATLAVPRLRTMAFRHLLVHDSKEKGIITEDMENRVRDILRNQYFINHNLKILQDCAPTSGEVQARYEKNRETYRTEERRKISVLYKVFPDDRKGSEGITEALKEMASRPDFKEDFTQYVKQHSDLPGATEGGIVAYFTKGTYGPLVEQHAFSTKPGELSPVFEGKSGAYIIKCLDVKPAGYIPLEEVYNDIRDEIRTEKYESAQKEYKEQASRKHNIYILKDADRNQSGETVVLKVNDFSLTYGNLLTLYPDAEKQIEENPGAFTESLEIMAVKEAVLQEFEKEIKADPRSTPAREYFLRRNESLSRLAFAAIASEKIQIRETEYHQYYNDHRDYYHAPAPRKLGYLLVTPPPAQVMTEPEYHKALEAQKRLILGFDEKIRKSPEDFLKEAGKLSESSADFKYIETDWIEEYPEGWRVDIAFPNLFKNRISPVFQIPTGEMVIFKVLEIGKARVLPFEEVEDKVRRVIRAKHEMDLMEELRKSLFEKYHFRIINPTTK
ncbi:MAG TPA: peptidyl-prolyl cis-trans isomerase [Candidatus Sumerlaeota bacterium]|nr:peptidyl-prolyl cis-trans isomerase [Candidatus Sumerlaeota bacterium]